MTWGNEWRREGPTQNAICYPQNTLYYKMHSDLFEKEGWGGKGKGPAVVVIEELLWFPGPIHHLIINTGNVEHQAHHQTEAWGVGGGGERERSLESRPDWARTQRGVE